MEGRTKAKRIAFEVQCSKVKGSESSRKGRTAPNTPALCWGKKRKTPRFVRKSKISVDRIPIPKRNTRAIFDSFSSFSTILIIPLLMSIERMLTSNQEISLNRNMKPEGPHVAEATNSKRNIVVSVPIIENLLGRTIPMKKINSVIVSTFGMKIRAVELATALAESTPVTVTKRIEFPSSTKVTTKLERQFNKNSYWQIYRQ